MPMNLLENDKAAYLVAGLCIEAGVCLTGNEYGNHTEITQASFDVQDGLLVTDRSGQTFRLEVLALRSGDNQLPGLREAIVDVLTVLDNMSLAMQQRALDRCDLSDGAYEMAVAKLRRAIELKPPAGTRAWTVTLAGSERHDGEKPYTYVLLADTKDDAGQIGLDHHLLTTGDEDLVLIEVLDGLPAPDCGFHWNDLRQVTPRRRNAEVPTELPGGPDADDRGGQPGAGQAEAGGGSDGRGPDRDRGDAGGVD